MRTGLYALVSLPLLLVCLAWDVVKVPVVLTFFLLIYILLWILEDKTNSFYKKVIIPICEMISMGVLYYIHKAWGVEMLKDRSI